MTYKIWTFIDHHFWAQGYNRHLHSLDLRQLILEMARLRQVHFNTLAVLLSIA